MLLRDGRVVPVEGVRHEPLVDFVYNFRVEDLACYAVGVNGVLVHNDNGVTNGLGGPTNKPLSGPGPVGQKALPAPTTVRSFNPSDFVGQHAIASPHLKAGTYTALVVDGKVYVARMHITAWELAGKQGGEQFYGFAEIDAAGNVVRLFQ